MKRNFKIDLITKIKKQKAENLAFTSKKKKNLPFCVRNYGEHFVKQNRRHHDKILLIGPTL